MKKNIIPIKILKIIPIRYRFLDEIIFTEEKKKDTQIKTTKNEFYLSEKMIHSSSYRKTSKLIQDE